MLAFTLQEAQLFRVLTGFFGSERVIPHLSPLMICGGSLPANIAAKNGEQQINYARLTEWSREYKCLFTIVNASEDPCMVVEFSLDFSAAVDLHALENHHDLTRVLRAQGIPYVTISAAEFSELLDPSGTLDFYHLLKDKFEGALETSDYSSDSN